MRTAIVVGLILLGIGIFILWFQEIRKMRKGGK